MKSKVYKTKDAGHDVIIMVGRNENGRIRKPITSIKIQGIEVSNVMEWLKFSISHDIDQYGTLDLDVIEKIMWGDDTDVRKERNKKRDK
jgi:hypothetical protein